MTDAFVLGGVRTPVGRYGGSLSHIRVDDLLGQTMVAACERVGVPARAHRGHRRRLREPGARGDGRHRALGGAGRRLPGFGAGDHRQPLLRLVAVGRDLDRARHPQRRAVGRPRRRRRVDVALGLGVDEGRRAVHAARARCCCSTRCGPAPAARRTPTLLARDAYIDMMQTAQNVADRYELTREEIDAFALRSHQHAAAARDSGRLAEEIHPVEIPATRKEPRPRSSSTTSPSATTRRRRSSPRCPPQPNTTQMTAGNSSPLNDGASAVVLASAAAAEELGAEPLARVVASATHALDPQVHGHRARVRDPEGAQARGARPGGRSTSGRSTRPTRSVAVAILRELPRQLDGFEVPDERLNPNGGAVAIGHPFGSSGHPLRAHARDRAAPARGALRRARRLRRLRPGSGARAREPKCRLSPLSSASPSPSRARTG